MYCPFNVARLHCFPAACPGSALRSPKLSSRPPIAIAHRSERLSFILVFLLLPTIARPLREFKWRGGPSFVMNVSLDNRLRINRLGRHIPRRDQVCSSRKKYYKVRCRDAEDTWQRSSVRQFVLGSSRSILRLANCAGRGSRSSCNSNPSRFWRYCSNVPAKLSPGRNSRRGCGLPTLLLTLTAA